MNTVEQDMKKKTVAQKAVMGIAIALFILSLIVIILGWTGFAMNGTWSAQKLDDGGNIISIGREELLAVIDRTETLFSQMNTPEKLAILAADENSINTWVEEASALRKEIEDILRLTPVSDSLKTTSNALKRIPSGRTLLDEMQVIAAESIATVSKRIQRLEGDIQRIEMRWTLTGIGLGVLVVSLLLLYGLTRKRSVYAKIGMTGLIKLFQYLALLLASAIAIIPIISVVIVSFKTDSEYMLTSKMALPDNWLNLDNFYKVWVDGSLGQAFVTSFVVVIVVVVVSVMLGSMLAYVLSRFAFIGNNIIRNMFLIATLIPGIAMQVTTYKIMLSLGLINSLPGYMIMLSGTDVIAIYIFMQYFENLSSSLDESAVLEGCSYFGVFFRILFPLLKPAMLTVMILKGVGVYNEYYAANLYLGGTFQTISKALYAFSGPYKSQYNVISAGVFFTMLPSLIVFLMFQKKIYAGLSTGSVKG
jgi:multiple sugar transport system permease protein